MQLLGVFASLQMVQEKKFVEEISVQQAVKSGIVVSTSLDLGHVWKADIITAIVASFDPAAYEDKILKQLP